MNLRVQYSGYYIHIYYALQLHFIISSSPLLTPDYHFI